MFPEFSPGIGINEEREEKVTGRSFVFDFEKGDFLVKDGKLVEVEGIEAIRIWIQKVLKTEKFKFKIYKTGSENEYGVTILELINSGHPQFFIQAEIQREIEEALLRNPDIKSVNNFNFERDKRTLIVNITVNTIYGSIEQGVLF